MADAAVRVDIVVGQNTVVPAVDKTGVALTGLTRTAGSLNSGMENLSKAGLRRVEAGMQALAFEAAGVPGPLGKIASGAVLLAGGSGILLAVAAAAGAVALAWKALTSTGDEATKAVERMTAALKKNNQALMDIDAGDRAANDLTSRAGWLMGAAGFIPGMQAVVNHLVGMANGIRQVTSAYADFSAHAAADDFLIGFWRDHPMPTKKAKAATGPDRTSQDWWLNQDFSKQSAINDLNKQAAELNAQLVQVPVNMDAVGAVLDSLDQQLQDAADRVGLLFYAFADGFINLAEAMGMAVVGAVSFGDAMKKALLGAVVSAAKTMAQFELAEAAASFAAAIGPIPRPHMVAAGLKHLAAAAAYGLVAGVAGGLGSGASRSASGGVNSGQLGRDASSTANAGTLTVQLRSDGLYAQMARDPGFQDFLAQVFKEAKGRNVQLVAA